MLPALLEQSSPCMEDESCWRQVYIHTGATGQCSRLSHLTTSSFRMWKSHLFSGSQENTEPGSAELCCSCYGCSNYIYYRESCQGERGSERIKRKQKPFSSSNPRHSNTHLPTNANHSDKHPKPAVSCPSEPLMCKPQALHVRNSVRAAV